MAVITAVGCGDPDGRVQVQGKLTAKGAPVDHATVFFVPIDGKAESAIGRVGPDGSFRLFGPQSRKQGIVPGEYRVTISRPVLPDGRVRNAVMPQPNEVLPEPAFDSIPKKYSAGGNSALTVTIPPKGGPLTIDLPEVLLERAPSATTR